MTGVYKPDYEGEILADLSRQGREYILVVHQDDSVVTLFFETLSLENISTITAGSVISG